MRVLATVMAAAAIVVALPPGMQRSTASAEPLGSNPAYPISASTDPIMRTGKLLGSPTAPDGSTIANFTILDGRNLELSVYSAAMKKNVRIYVLRPRDTSKPRPTLYQVVGAGGGEDSATWTANTDVIPFLATKNVNVILPFGGAWTYYTDWRAPDPHLGVNKWNTFFTKELPPLVDGALGTDKINAIAGLSTSETSILRMAEENPGLYKSVAGYSGCAQIADPTGYRFINLAVETWGGGNTKNMYGPQNDPMWFANDPYVHADELRGMNIFLSAGNGLPGRYDVLDGRYALPGAYGLANQLVIGGVIEAGVSFCTHNLQAKLNALGIPATYDFTPGGTHSWGYWRDAFYQSWPTLARGLGLPV